MININLIDPSGIDSSHSPADAMLANLQRKLIAAFSRKQFGIAQPANAVRRIAIRIKDDSSGYYGPKQRPSAHFINSGN